MNGQNTIIPHASIVSDMRSIAAYLTGLLQHQRHQRCPEIYHFLDFGSHESDSSKHSSYFERSGSAENEEYDTEEEDRQSMSRSMMESDVILNINDYILDDSTLTREQDIDASQDEAERMSNGQERWRKLFVNIRVHLKPTAIAIRCRLFEGVLTGADICKWLVQSQYKYAQDSAEACAIGQELLACSLLIPVTCGHVEDHHSLMGLSDDGYDSDEGSRSSDYESGRDSDVHAQPPLEPSVATVAAVRGTAQQAYYIDPKSDLALAFSTGAAYLYKYPSKSHTSESIGSFTLLGALSPSNVQLNRWAKRDNRKGSEGADSSFNVLGMCLLGFVSSGFSFIWYAVYFNMCRRRGKAIGSEYRRTRIYSLRSVGQAP